MLLGVALVIALLGIMNTLMLSIVERTRELGLVRAVGLSRGGVVRMIGVESVLIAVFGCLLGVALGIGLAAAAVKALIDMEIMTTFALPWTNLIAYVLVALLSSVSWRPCGRRGARPSSMSWTPSPTSNDRVICLAIAVGRSVKAGYCQANCRILAHGRVLKRTIWA